MPKDLTTCSIDGLRVLEVVINPQTGGATAKLGLTIAGQPAAQAELLGIQMLPGIQDKIEELVAAVEEEAAKRYGASDEETVRQLNTPPAGLGGI